MENAIFTDAAERSAAINLKSKDAPEDLLTKEYVELLTSPLDLAAYEGAAMWKVRTKALWKTRKPAGGLRPGNGDRGLYPTLLLRNRADWYECREILAHAHLPVSRPVGLPQAVHRH